MVSLLRLSPVLPFNLQNHFYGITDRKLREYVVATFFGIMPGTLVTVYVGAAGKAVSGDDGSTLKWGFFAVGLIATVVVAVFGAKKAKAQLKEHGVGSEKSGDTTAQRA